VAFLESLSEFTEEEVNGKINEGTYGYKNDKIIILNLILAIYSSPVFL